MFRFRISTVLILTAIVGVLLIHALSRVAYERKQLGLHFWQDRIVHDTRPPTLKEVAQRLAVTLPAAILVWTGVRRVIRKLGMSRSMRRHAPLHGPVIAGPRIELSSGTSERALLDRRFFRSLHFGQPTSMARLTFRLQ